MEFKLTKDNIARLTERFRMFMNARRTVRDNMNAYIDGWKNLKGSPKERTEELEREFMTLAPQMSHLIHDEGNVLWHADDIAIMMGRHQSAISRVLSRMEMSDKWCSRLLALRHETKSSNNNLIYAYEDGIFDLIFDKYEDEYLNRFMRPRRGIIPADSNEVLRFWHYLKESYLNERNENDKLSVKHDENDSREQIEVLPDLPLMKWNDVISLIFRRVITPAMGIIFTVLFALSFETARRLPMMIPVFASVWFSVLGICAVMLRFRHPKSGRVSNIAAASLLMSCVWGIALFSDGRIYAFGGSVMNLNDEYAITIEPMLWSNHETIFYVNSNRENEIKEIFYRTDRNREFISAKRANREYPDHAITPKIRSGKINLEVKYTDIKNKEHGPYKFEIDIDKERFRLSKEYISAVDWIFLNTFGKIVYVSWNVSFSYPDRIVKALAYGVNKDKPDIIIQPDENTHDLFQIPYNELEYVSAYVIFSDNTSTDIKRFEPFPMW